MLNGSPQLEDGHTRIANELLDAIIRFDFSKRQYKVMLAILRKTYGYGKKSDDISSVQIANLTGLDDANVRKTLKELVSLNAVSKQPGQHGQVVAIQKNYGRWGSGQNNTGQNNPDARVKTTHTKENPNRGSSLRSEPPAASVVTLPLKDGTEFEITPAMLTEWKTAYPGKDVDGLVRQAVQWCRDNPSRRKTRVGARRYLSGWIARQRQAVATTPTYEVLDEMT